MKEFMVYVDGENLKIVRADYWARDGIWIEFYRLDNGIPVKSCAMFNGNNIAGFVELEPAQREIKNTLKNTFDASTVIGKDNG